MHHYRKKHMSYLTKNQADKKQSGCPFPFCKEGNAQAIDYQNDTMFVIKNRVLYDIFEGRKVEDHLLLIPKRHVETMNDFTDQEMIDHMAIAGKYEVQGYNVYARGVGVVSRSVAHQHTHLIKMVNRKAGVIVYTRKPYLLLHF